MKETIKIIAVLTAICVVCAFALSFVYSLAKEKIALNLKMAIENAITSLAPDAKRIEEIKINDDTVYRLYNAEDKLFAYAFIAEGQGYQGKIKMLSVIDSSLQTLEGIEVIESVETPGLGARIQEDFFKKQFKALAVTPAIEYLKDTPQKGNQIQAITGATVSSKAVVNILNKRIKRLKEQVAQ